MMTKELITILIAATPVVELRGALPVALEIYHFSILKSFLLVFIGNMLPMPIIYLLLNPVCGFLMKKFDWARRFFNWLFDRTRGKFIESHRRWGKLALVVFVGIPLPGTGAWTGVLAAWLFGYKYKESLILLSLGVIMSGIIVLALDKGLSFFF